MVLPSIGTGMATGFVPLGQNYIGDYGTGYYTAMFVHTTATSGMEPLAFSTDLAFFGFPWTTGSVSGVAFTGYAPTRTTAMGYDNRSTGGKGTIQLVTPLVYSFDSLPFGDVGGFANTWKVKLTFVPEPRGLLMLGAGFALLGLVYRTPRR